MTLFDHQRLSNDVLKLDLERLRQGYYSDMYFENVVAVMPGIRAAHEPFSGTPNHDLPPSSPPRHAVERASGGEVSCEAIQ